MVNLWIGSVRWKSEYIFHFPPHNSTPPDHMTLLQYLYANFFNAPCPDQKMVHPDRNKLLTLISDKHPFFSPCTLLEKPTNTQFGQNIFMILKGSRQLCCCYWRYHPLSAKYQLQVQRIFKKYLFLNIFLTSYLAKPDLL